MPQGSRIRALTLAAFAWLSAAAASAQNAPAPAPLSLDGDAARGETLAYACAGCHGVPGYRNTYPMYHVPKLGGQNADYLEIALQGYRRGSRFHATMQAQASGLSDQDIADIAAYFAGLEDAPGAGRSAASRTTVAAGRQTATSCVPCHGESGIAQSPQWPDLAGQHASYLEQAITQYQRGLRSDPVMAPLVTGLDAEAIAELAAFYSAQVGLSETAD